MTQRIDIAGQKFNMLTAIEHIEGVLWRCVCDCGVEKSVASYPLRRGRIKSCGCSKSELLAARTRTHGMTKTPTYRSWLSMRRCCNEPSHPQYKYYGGRGIKVCERWLKFENFLADMGERPDGTTVDRIDGSKDYEPGNCRWATQAEQMNNTSRSVSYQGKTLKQWSQELGIKYHTLTYRLRTHGTIFL